MAKNWVSQEVYNAMTGLAKDKNEYEYLDSVGATTERDAYGKAAASKYDVINAYSPELVAKIKNSNAQQTRDLIKEYGVARDAKTISNDIIAKKFGYNEKYLSHTLYTLTGVHFTKLVGMYRIEHAKNLIINSQKKISAITITNVAITAAS